MAEGAGRDFQFASLIVLSYKRLDFLKRTLDSLFAHTTDFPYELIVVDDGSGNAQLDWLTSLVKGGKISYLLANGGGNLGVGAGINRGFAIARGDFVVKLDSDLEFQPRWLGQAVRLMNAFRDVGMLGFFHYLHDPCDHRKLYRHTLHTDHLMVEIHEDFVGSAFIMRRSDYLAWGPLLESTDSFGEDYVYKLMIKERYDKLLALPTKDLISNFGFGIPHSTVVQADGSVTKVHTLPNIVYPSSV